MNLLLVHPRKKRINIALLRFGKGEEEVGENRKGLERNNVHLFVACGLFLH